MAPDWNVFSLYSGCDTQPFSKKEFDLSMCESGVYVDQFGNTCARYEETYLCTAKVGLEPSEPRCSK